MAGATTAPIAVRCNRSGGLRRLRDGVTDPLVRTLAVAHRSWAGRGASAMTPTLRDVSSMSCRRFRRLSGGRRIADDMWNSNPTILRPIHAGAVRRAGTIAAQSNAFGCNGIGDPSGSLTRIITRFHTRVATVLVTLRVGIAAGTTRLSCGLTGRDRGR